MMEEILSEKPFQQIGFAYKGKEMNFQTHLISKTKRNFVLNNNKDMKRITSIRTKMDLLILLLNGNLAKLKKIQMAKNSSTYIANGKIRLVVKNDGWLGRFQNQDQYII